MSLRLGQLSTALRSATMQARTKLRPSTPPPAAAPPARQPIATELKFERTDAAGECLLALEGALNLHTAPELRAVFDSVVAAQPDLLTLDLEGLTMLDSSGVGAIVSLFKRVRAFGGTVRIQGVKNQPLAVCKLLKLDRVFGLAA